MTDRTDHRAEAESLLADANDWAAVAGELSPRASERACLDRAQVHALLAIHDALTAADPKPEPVTATHPWRNPLTATHPWPPWPSTLPDVDAADRYAANEERQREAEPDPLDEGDWRDRVDADGDRLTRRGVRRWNYWDAACASDSSSPEPLAYFDAVYGPLAFAPDAAQEATGGDLSAPEGESGAEEGGEAEEAAEPLLCPECGDAGDSIDEHNARGCRYVMCDCQLSPSDIARALIERATGADEDVRFPDGWKLVDGHDVHRVGSSPGEREGLVVRDHRLWYAMSAVSGEWRVCATKQDAANWVIKQTGDGRG